jgi:FkbM family methyltransferase
MYGLLKTILKKLPFDFTRNQRYDRLTKKIIRAKCTQSSCCIDVGTHRGEILDLFLKQSPAGHHFGFEPIPELYEYLGKKYEGVKNCSIYPVAVSDKKGSVSFNHVISNPAYSGIRKRRYDRAKERDVQITVATDTLDNIIPENQPVHLVKIDVEGAEMLVLQGASRILHAYKPLIIFEFGLGGSDVYGTTPEKLFPFLKKFGYDIFLLEAFLNNTAPLSLDELQDQFIHGRNYYFIAA